MSTDTRRRTWRRAGLVARFRERAARLVPYLRSRPRWLVATGWAVGCGVLAGMLGAWLVISWAIARRWGGGLAA